MISPIRRIFLRETREDKWFVVARLLVKQERRLQVASFGKPG